MEAGVQNVSFRNIQQQFMYGNLKTVEKGVLDDYDTGVFV